MTVFLFGAATGVAATVAATWTLLTFAKPVPVKVPQRLDQRL